MCGVWYVSVIYSLRLCKPKLMRGLLKSLVWPLGCAHFLIERNTILGVYVDRRWFCPRHDHDSFRGRGVPILDRYLSLTGLVKSFEGKVLVACALIKETRIPGRKSPTLLPLDQCSHIRNIW